MASQSKSTPTGLVPDAARDWGYGFAGVGREDAATRAAIRDSKASQFAAEAFWAIALGFAGEAVVARHIMGVACPLSAGGAPKAVGATGRLGEQALRGLGGESQVFFRTSRGSRYVDQLVDGIAHESKVGYTTLTRGISKQIAKDAELIATDQVRGVTWHFFQSPVTGFSGPSAPLRKALGDAGIGIVVH